MEEESENIFDCLIVNSTEWSKYKKNKKLRVNWDAMDLSILVEYMAIWSNKRNHIIWDWSFSASLIPVIGLGWSKKIWHWMPTLCCCPKHIKIDNHLLGKVFKHDFGYIRIRHFLLKKKSNYSKKAQAQSLVDTRGVKNIDRAPNFARNQIIHRLPPSSSLIPSLWGPIQ